MKLYVYDKFWQGAVIVVAKDINEAAAKIKEVKYFDDVLPRNITEYELDSVIVTAGDA